jgi:hypothetical protein
LPPALAGGIRIYCKWGKQASEYSNPETNQTNSLLIVLHLPPALAGGIRICIEYSNPETNQTNNLLIGLHLPPASAGGKKKRIDSIMQAL